jgi:putative membrane protein (TIGR04086 family)
MLYSRRCCARGRPLRDGFTELRDGRILRGEMSVERGLRAQPLLWGRAILYALLIEAILIGLFIAGMPLGMTVAVDAVLAVVGSFVLSALFAMRLGRRLRSRFVAHGLLIGAAAFAIFIAIDTIGRRFNPDVPPQSVAYWIAHVLKFAGGALGGAIAARRGHRQQTSFVAS